jgi:hypothetical protein
MGRLEDTLSWLINLIAVAENLYTVFQFDEDKFGAMYIALVLYIDPIATMVMKRYQAKWGQLTSDISQEGCSCFLFMWFCNFEEEAVIVLIAMTAVQVLLIVVLYVKENCIVAPEDTSKNAVMNGAGWKNVTCCFSLSAYIVYGGIPLPYLLYQDEAPFRQKPFEVVLACWLWLNDLGMQAQYKKLEETLQGIGDNFEDAEKANEAIAEAVKNMPPTRVMQFTRLSQPAFFVYLSVLAWMYWFSDDIGADFDKGYTMFTMVMTSIMVCCGPLSMYLKFKQRTKPPEDGQPAGEQKADVVDVEAVRPDVKDGETAKPVVEETVKPVVEEAGKPTQAIDHTHL